MCLTERSRFAVKHPTFHQNGAYSCGCAQKSESYGLYDYFIVQSNLIQLFYADFNAAVK